MKGSVTTRSTAFCAASASRRARCGATYAARSSRHPQAISSLTTRLLDKDYSEAIELVRPHYRSKTHGVIKGFDVVTCVHIDPDTDHFLLIDCRIHNPDECGKSKL